MCQSVPPSCLYLSNCARISFSAFFALSFGRKKRVFKLLAKSAVNSPLSSQNTLSFAISSVSGFPDVRFKWSPTLSEKPFCPASSIPAAAPGILTIIVVLSIRPLSNASHIALLTLSLIPKSSAFTISANICTPLPSLRNCSIFP